MIGIREKKINLVRKEFSNWAKASSIADYSILVFAVVLALIIMGVYLKRGICGKWKEAADVFGHGRQYQKQ